MTKSCFNCANKEEIYDNGEEKVVVCEINRYIENIYPREAEATASRCIAYKEESLTNEEWFCQLSTEEKAEWLIEFAIRFIPCELIVPSKKIKTYKNNILEWLKQPHQKE